MGGSQRVERVPLIRNKSIKEVLGIVEHRFAGFGPFVIYRILLGGLILGWVYGAV